MANSTAGLPAFSEATSEQLAEIITQAHLPSLLTTLSFLIGDRSLLAPEFRAVSKSASMAGMEPAGGLSESVAERARERALGALLRFRDSGFSAAPAPSHDDLLELMEFMTGPVGESYLPLLLHELGYPEDHGEPTWRAGVIAPGRDYRVAVIGAGMSGLLAAHRLDQAGVDHVVFERSDDVGGVWRANDYPGARLDTSNFTYSYSFAQRSWSDQYSKRDDILDYFRSVARDHGIVDRIQFNTEVTDGYFDEELGFWVLTIRKQDGSTQTAHFNAVISAVGQLSQPQYPEILGMDLFQGASWHTADWDHDVDLVGKRVAVIGTGASAFQVIPSLAERAEKLTIFQRTPAWVVPTPGYMSPLPDGLQWLFENLPQYNRWYRLMQFYLNVDGIRHLAVVDPEWNHPVSVSKGNDEVRVRFETFLRESFADRPDLLKGLIPSYPPYAKRSVRDDGTWVAAMKRRNVSLVTSGIARITPTGVLDVDGRHHDVDVIVYGTGFKASEFLSSLPLRGRGGATIQEQWGGNARAYYGITLPNFPNLYMLYGPNTNLNTNGSTVLFSEAGIRYILACIETQLEHGYRALDLRREPFEAFNAKVDAASLTIAVGASSVNSWYKNKFGRNSQNWPLPTIDYWEGTKGPARDEYDVL